VNPDPDAALGFYTRAEAFYARLAKRRLNALETFNDPFLRGHFRSKDAFFDYYADLAHQLDLAHFEKSRPSGVEVEEFVFETSSLAGAGPPAPTTADAPRCDDAGPPRPLGARHGAWWLIPEVSARYAGS
jgi:hypothetical protein